MSQLVLKHPDLKHEDLKFNTVEVHAGEPRDMYGALIPPIYQTSTFYFDSTDDAVKACDDYAESFAYSRITNPSVDYLEQKLAALEAMRPMEVVRQARMTMNPRRRLPIGPK